MFISAIISQLTIFVIYYFMIYSQEKLGYLWLNFIGAILTIVVAIILQFLFFKGKKENDELILE
jgi:ABC-type Fe3+-siderophore transport system permease subunit